MFVNAIFNQMSVGHKDVIDLRICVGRIGSVKEVIVKEFIDLDSDIVNKFIFFDIMIETSNKTPKLSSLLCSLPTSR